MNPEGEKKKPGMSVSHVRRLRIILVATIVAAVGLYFLIAYLLYRPVPLDHVQFANGKTVYVGMSVKDFTKVMGSDLIHLDGTDDYDYFDLKTYKSVGSFLVKKGKVVVIRFGGSAMDKQVQSDLHYHSAISNVESMFAGKLTKINQKFPYDQAAVGYSYSNSWHTKSYYFVSPCTPNDQVVIIAIAEKQYEKDAIGQGMGCGAQEK